MAEPIRLFIVAGEPSGDLIGADLVQRLRVTHRVELTGVGGDALAGEGLKSLFPMSDLSVMGLRDVLARAPLLLWRIRQTALAIRKATPDVVVLIDSQVFCQKVAERLRKAGFAGKIILCVAPSVWAWKPERAVLLKPLYDEILAVLPFEPAVMRRLGGPPTTYIGHPALGHTSLRARQPTSGPLLLLPGSRRGELREHLALMRAVALALRNHPRVTGFILPTPRVVENIVVEAVAAWETPVFVTSSNQAKWQGFRDAVASVAVIGTVTLELALSGVPMVVTYVAERAQMQRIKKYNVQHLALPNILYGSSVVPEVVGLGPQPDAVVAELVRILDDPSLTERQTEAFRRIREGMEKGAPDAPPADPAARILAQLDQRLSTGV